ncbi:anti-sigma-k factor [Leptolyngbya sp. Heron Island J]|uniref:anti-sigma factor domain-containing protein n=1 Tax=Leptolyngbya sp. Heron Island J TaxID=1385935 RepID=UPI0003B9D62C|nr:anti-sigma factor [Leptolyngbya sp. Heron Island J]ESA35804.1 anti-sigma-k factor [Leptolyngbya sp. Heron Island J]
MPFDSPSTSDPHPDWHDLLAGYALDNLSPEERETLQTLLAQRPELKAELLAYQETLALVPYALDPAPLPRNLEATIIAIAQRTKRATQTGQAPSNPQPRRRQRRWYALTMVAALLIAIIGTDNYRLRQQQIALQTQLGNAQVEQQALQTAKETLQAQLEATETQLAAANVEAVLNILRQPNALVYSLQGTDNASTSSGSLLTLPDHSEVQLVSHNLPVLPTGQVYRLWSVATETSTPMFCGQFNNTEEGSVQWTVPDALCNAKPAKVIITVDAVIDPPVPKGPPVLTGEI